MMRRVWLLVGLLPSLAWTAPSVARQDVVFVRPTAADRQSAAAIAEYLDALRAQDAQEPPAVVIEHLSRALEKNPDIAPLYYQRAQLHARSKEWSQALSDAQRAIAIDSDRVTYHLLYARLLSVTDRPTDAVAHLQQLLPRHPRAPRIYQHLARLYIQQQQYAAAEKTLRQLLRVRPDSVAARIELGKLYAGPLKRIPAAMRMYRDAVRLRPGNVSATLLLAQLALEHGKPREALHLLLALEERGVSDVSIQLRIGMLYYDLRNYAEAIRRLESVLVSHPQADKLRYYLGVLYEESDNPGAAETTFALVPSTSELYKDAQLRRAVARAQTQHVPEAIAIVQRALAQRPDIAAFYEYLAYLQDLTKDYSGAQRTLRHAMQKFPQDQSFIFKAALLHDRLKQHSAAVRLMRRLLVLDPKNVTALNYVGFMYAEWNRHLNDAEAMLQRAVQLQPNDGHVIDSLAWLYYRKGDLDYALQLIEAAQRLSPDEPAVLRHYGQILFKMGESDKAVYWWRRAQHVLQQQSEPDDADELQQLDKLLKNRAAD